MVCAWAVCTDYGAGGDGVTELTASEGLNYKFNSKICRQKFSEVRKVFPKLATVEKYLANVPAPLQICQRETLQNRN